MEKIKQMIIAISAIVTIFAAVIIVGCVEKEVPTPINNTVFKNITAAALDDIAYQLEDIETAQDKGDFVKAKSKLATFDTSMRQYITKFEELKVAENTLPCKKALINVFEESRLLGVSFDAYLENPTVDKYLRYGAQAINVSNQVEIGAMLSKDL